MAAEKTKGSPLGAIVSILLLTAAAGGGGALIGLQIVSSAKSALEKSAAPPGDKPATPKGGASDADARMLKELVPVVTNLASPEDAWIRLQAAIVYDRSDAAGMDVVATKIGEDILAFVRTLTLSQIQGASGLEGLREDLNERASVRSDGKVREVLIEMLVVK